MRAPSRVSFFEMQARAVRMKDVVIPAMAAAALGFFVSLAASFVDGGFSAPIATVLDIAGSTYLYLVFVGVIVSMAGFLVLMDWMRSDVRGLVRHPSSINRAAELLLRGKEVQGLEVHDLRRSLDLWQAKAGREAMRVVIWRNDSPHVNALLQEVRKAERRPCRPRHVSVRLLWASFADQRIRGVLLALGFFGPCVMSIAATCVALSKSGRAAEEASGWQMVVSHLRFTPSHWRCLVPPTQRDVRYSLLESRRDRASSREAENRAARSRSTRRENFRADE